MSLEKATRTVDGTPVRVICTDAKGRAPVVALVDCPCCGEEEPHYYTADGRWIDRRTGHDDGHKHGADSYDLDLRVLN